MNFESYKCGNCGYIMNERLPRCPKCHLSFYKITTQEEENQKIREKQVRDKERNDKHLEEIKVEEKKEIPDLLNDALKIRNRLKRQLRTLGDSKIIIPIL